MSSNDIDPPPRKLLAGWALKLRIAALCLGLLVLGAWLAPPEGDTLATSEERAAPLLEQQVQQRDAARPFRGVQEVVGRVTHRGVTVLRPDTRARVGSDFTAGAGLPSRGFGVVVDDAHVLSHTAAIGGRRTAVVQLAGGQTLSASVTAFDPPTGLVLLRLAGAAPPAAVVAAAAPEAGSLAVAAAVEDGGDLTVPVFITAVAPPRYRVSAAASLAPGLPIYNLDGELMAVANGGDTAWPVPGALRRLRRADRPSSFGIAFQALVDAPLQRAFGDAGVVVVDVVAGGPADVAGIREGDVITAIGDVPLTADKDVAVVLATRPIDAVTNITIRRDGKSLAIEATAADAYDVAALAQGATTAPAPLQAGAVFDAAALAAAGVPPAAVVRRINGLPVASAAQATRALRRARGEAVALLDHADQRFFAVIGTAR